MLLGTIAGLFGIRGQVKIAPTGIGHGALRARLPVILRSPPDREVAQRVATIETIRFHKRMAVAKFKEISRAENAQTLAGYAVWTVRQNVVLEKDEYFDEDLIGCTLVQHDRVLGTVVAVRHYPAQDVLELTEGGFVPMVAAFVRAIDLEARRINVELPPGLLEGEPI